MHLTAKIRLPLVSLCGLLSNTIYFRSISLAKTTWRLTYMRCEGI